MKTMQGTAMIAVHNVHQSDGLAFQQHQSLLHQVQPADTSRQMNTREDRAASWGGSLVMTT
jgi:hypothetical protein